MSQRLAIFERPRYVVGMNESDTDLEKLRRSQLKLKVLMEYLDMFESPSLLSQLALDGGYAGHMVREAKRELREIDRAN